MALIETKAGERASLRIKVDTGTPARIIGFEVSEAPPTVEAAGPYSGRFDIGGRELFLHCTGSGSPTVVFQGGLTTDWARSGCRPSGFGGDARRWWGRVV